jgi:hypothetical protein
MEWAYSSTYSWPWRSMAETCQPQLRPLYLLLFFRQETGPDPRPVWAQWRLERSHTSAADLTPTRLSPSP